MPDRAEGAVVRRAHAGANDTRDDSRARGMRVRRLQEPRAFDSRTVRQRVAARGSAVGLVAALLLLVAPAPSHAFTFFDGKLEVHGYAATQIRTLAKNLNVNEEWDLSQWYNIANIEVEAKPFPNGLGPVEILEFYVRGEVRYDCVWTRACGIFPSVNTYGDRAERLPKRLINGDYAGFTGTLQNGDTRLASNVDRNNYTLAFRDTPTRQLREPMSFAQLPGLVSLFGNGDGPNQTFEPLLAGRSDDPPSHYFDTFLKRCKFGVRNSRGGENGQIFDLIGPWNPDCEIEEIGALRYKGNPFNRNEFLSVLAGVDGIPNTGDECANPLFANPPEDTGCPGAPGVPIIVPTGRGNLPYRAAPFYPVNQLAPKTAAQGLYVPSSALIRTIDSGRLDSIDQNFSQEELAWNRGASQQDEKELKEAYADIEMFEGRLWLRLGKQAIVWGKTELFRNTDQFNPQDFALASIPSLEESRIALWAARGTWSFYNFGKIEDVRLELAVNLDDFEPADLGRCGEPYTLELVCGISLGYFAHGFSGAGLAGTDRPPSPWEDISGLEGGARLEWRYGKFSFQLSDFYGYDDFPHTERISTYERNVDPDSGRPRRAGDHSPCSNGTQGACLGVQNPVLVDDAGDPLRLVDTDEDGGLDTLLMRGQPLWHTGELVISEGQQFDALQNHAANQTLFATGNILCGTAGNNVDPALCGFVSLNGKGGPGAAISTVAMGASALMAGSGTSAALSAFNNGFLCTLVIGNTETRSQNCFNVVSKTFRALNVDLSDCGAQTSAGPLPCKITGGANLGAFSDGGGSPFQNPSPRNPANLSVALGASLTPEQEALLGCGPFYQSDCDLDGIDPLNADASVIIQSWPGFEGTRGSVDNYDLTDTSIVHPGTVGFQGGPVATVFANGQLQFLPGSLGPNDPGYDSLVDGCTGPGPAGCNAGDVATIDANRDGVPDVTVTRTTNARLLTNPLNGQVFANELAAVSHNMLMLFATGSSKPTNPDAPNLSEFDIYDPEGLGIINNPNSPQNGQVRPGVNPASVNGVTAVACGIRKPQLCNNIQGFLAGVGVRRNSVRAGANNGFGRRDFAWHSSGELVLNYNKRNVLGFAFDFDEERTKTNWGVEATWVAKQIFLNNDEYDGISDVDTLNLTVSVDRPTFINFLNQGRTFFFNSQWFFQYIPDYGQNYNVNGPLNVLATFTAFTGYFQDRLTFYTTAVYDFNSGSGALLPSVSYRFTENFSAAIGVNVFWGHQQLRDAPINEIRPGLNRVGRNAYQDAVENGLTALRERDEMNFTLRYTF